tara:strand:+ start:713 stop:1297 length:585 start_codon:yes stop_codon:yes gene_type:complete
MRVFIIVLVLIFSLQSWTKADDIRDFEIEGMSIGDSLLDHFSEEEIKNHNQDNYYNWVKEKKKFTIMEILGHKNFRTFDGMQFAYKKNDPNYIIYDMNGILLYKNKINECKSKMKDISKDVEGMFNNLQKTKKNNVTHPDDPSGKSKVFKIVYWFPSNDLIGIKCFDWSKSKGYDDNLKFQLKTKEFNEWLTPG